MTDRTQSLQNQTVAAAADELLSPREDGDRLSVAVAALYSLCSSVTGVDDDSKLAEDSGETGLPGGKAISPKDAARCVLDFNRTSKFLRGLHAAVLEARERFPGTTVEILYAGCGPFAPLAVLLAGRFNPSEIRFTLLDIHKRSLDAARLIFQALGAEAFVRDYIQGDAASYKHGAAHGLHIVVVEAMQAALEKEPQVAITLNLAPQLSPGGIFIPERVAVDCCLCAPAKESALLTAGAHAASPPDASEGGDRAGALLGRVLELSAEACRNASAPEGGERPGRPFPPKVTLDVPKVLEGEPNLMLLTTINVFGSIVLESYESGLTWPRVLCDLGKVRGGMRVEFAYRQGGSPGFSYRAL